MKPTIPNNTKLEDFLIKYRSEFSEHIECYLLDNFNYLYLFKKQPDIPINKNLKEIKFGKDRYLFYISSTHYDDLEKLWKNLTTIKGFALVAGMNNVKEQLYKDVIFPVLNPEKYERFHVSIPNGILLYGPTGCGKTFIVEKLAEELQYNFIKVDHSDLASPYIHESVIKISKLFEKAKKQAPCILFLDEIEALMPDRNAMSGPQQFKRDETNEFLIKLNNAGKDKILVIGATNNIELMDPAILRSGRFDVKIYIPAPDTLARQELFKIALKNRPTNDEIDFPLLAESTEGYSCSDIIHIVEDSARSAIINNETELTTKRILTVIEHTKTSLK